MATIVELLHTLVGDVRSGVPVLMIKKRGREQKKVRWPRPPWIEAPEKTSETTSASSEIVVHSPGELVDMLTRGGGES